MGYSPQSKAYKLYNPLSGKVIISKDVVFHEAARWDLGEKHVQHRIPLEVSATEKHEPTPTTSPKGRPAILLTHSPNKYTSPAISKDPPVTLTSPQLRRSTRDRRPNPKYVDTVYTSCGFVLLVSDPLCFKEAVKKPELCKAKEEEL